MLRRAASAVCGERPGCCLLHAARASVRPVRLRFAARGVCDCQCNAQRAAAACDVRPARLAMCAAAVCPCGCGPGASTARRAARTGCGLRPAARATAVPMRLRYVARGPCDCGAAHGFGALCAATWPVRLQVAARGHHCGAAAVCPACCCGARCAARATAACGTRLTGTCIVKLLRLRRRAARMRLRCAGSRDCAVGPGCQCGARPVRLRRTTQRGTLRHGARPRVQAARPWRTRTQTVSDHDSHGPAVT